MFKKFFKRWYMTDQEKVEEYLSHSVSLYDLERRQKELRLRGYNA